MKALIFGAGGQLGRTLARTAPAGVACVALTRAEVDVTDEMAVLSSVTQHRPDVILNASAYTAVDRAESEPGQARAANADAPAFIARAAGTVEARLLHVSTDFVFDGRTSTPYLPSAETNPLNVYGTTKRNGELAVTSIAPRSSVVLRTAWVYASSGSNFVRTMLRVMNERKALRVVADQIGTPTSAVTLAEVLWKLAPRRDITGIHHYSDAGVASWYDFAVAIHEEASALGLAPAEVTVSPIASEEYPTPARRPRFSVLDKKSLLSALDLEPRHWRQPLRAMLGELRNAP